MKTKEWNTLAECIIPAKHEELEDISHYETEKAAEGLLKKYPLAAVAADILPLIDDVFDLVKEPGIFHAAMEKIDSSIASYPEWMDEGEACVLGKNATRCVLKWLWLVSQGDVHPGSAFVASVHELENKFNMVDLNDDESIAFFAELPDAACQEIYEHMRSNNCQCKLDEVYSKWHKINHLYQQRFDKRQPGKGRTQR